MKKYKVRIKEMPSMAYGGQRGYNLDLGHNVLDEQMRNDMPYSTVSDTLQPVPREMANLEAERGETVMGDIDGDGMQEHMKIGGKRHSQGGTPLNLRPGSFVFSDTKKMMIGGAPLEMFGKNPDSKKKYTPAALAKQYDLNKYKAIMDDPYADPLAKRTAQMMMENNQKKLGQLALVQESLKGFPQGIPDIAMSAMPQAAYGGLMQYQTKGQVTEDYRKRTKDLDPYREKGFNSFDDVVSYYGGRGYTGGNNVDAWQKWLIEQSAKDSGINADLVNYLRNVPLTNKGKKMFPGKTVEQLSDEELKQQFNDGLFDFRAPRLMEVVKRQLPTYNTNFPLPVLNYINPITSVPTSLTKEEEEPEPTGPTPGQPGDKFTMPRAGYMTPDKLAALQALMTKANLPTIRPFMTTPGYVKPQGVFMDPTRDYAANAEQANMIMQGMRTFSRPQQFLAGASQVAGKTLAANEAAASAVNKQNVMLANQLESQGAAMDNQYMAQRAQAANMYGEMANNAMKENFRNENAANSQMVAAANNAWNNRMMANMTNAANPYFMLDPRSGMVNLKDPNRDVLSMIRGASGSGSGMGTYPELLKYATQTLKMPADKAEAWVQKYMEGKSRVTSTDKNNDGYPDYSTMTQFMMPFMQMMGRGRGMNPYGYSMNPFGMQE